MKPIIGVTPSMEVSQIRYSVMNDNIKAILQAGGIPVILPYLSKNEDLNQIANQIDGLYATGGDDIDPTLFGEEPHPKLGTIIPARDRFEIALTKKMLELKKPILGVCRGAQILNIAAGGDMYQDIYEQIDRNLLQHAQKAPRGYGSHFVDVLEGSLLHQLAGSRKLRVNSYHHQANRSVPTGFQISGYASDSVIEAVESTVHPFVLGVQWHPEAMAADTDETSWKIYRGFVAACVK
ncbi:gamma-glutamyl-gamma-aminobutyrate hydrolase family protein [Oceanobacillus sp. 143]|jgi:putative glutamine amidotransferase|uniref:Gamma-glutamyl-gamma-aminobutyrate hydrolase n=1 Tax=Oceanobacillus zhaokaii TaxID=2052660 RepID=A0A345PDU0_9BACI|nr:gamma-glutamyl-gamma-aminobutyrate hydrolase family protein [Oceanobacillus zhaokaii]AXI08170.1 gamma-glutamyl-gamma-aminobutyrate hydrolase [Oceanobacillus zhaokaii]QGS68116.1 gamma-glutamyl-gamma-aminobutyrate hydrolase family protein [Oceanobacillus sp. 143]